MTDFFLYEDLSWPEVAALPRDLPLIIPLGGGYPIEILEQALSHPERAGLLPPIPFGWRSSGLAVPEPVLAAYLGNLLKSLQDDGVTRVYGMLPKGLDLDPGMPCIHLPVGERLAAIPRLPAESELDKVIVIPIGHTEQHGYHLPLNVDTLIIEAIAQGAAAQAPDLAFAMPVMPYGVSTHRAAFAGTLNAGGRAFEDFWLAVLDVLIARGFNRFYLLSGHGGNCSFLVNVVKYAGERHPEAFTATAWLYLSGPKGAAALQAHRQSAVGGMGHACELETAYLLYLRPDLCHMERVVDEIEEYMIGEAMKLSRGNQGLAASIHRLTRVRIALIRQFTVTINGLVAAPLQFCADRRFAGTGHAVNQIISPAHGSLIPFRMGCCTCADSCPGFARAPRAQSATSVNCPFACCTAFTVWCFVGCLRSLISAAVGRSTSSAFSAKFGLSAA